jgi:hypothetical protein
MNLVVTLFGFVTGKRLECNFEALIHSHQHVDGQITAVKRR